MERTGPPWPPWALPGLIALFQVVGSVGAADNQPDREPIDALAVALLLVGPVALAWGARHRVLALTATVAATVAYLQIGYPYGPIFASLVLALFGTVNGGERTAAWLVAGTGFAAYLAVGYTVGEDRPTAAHIAGVTAWLVVVLVVAEVVRARGERAAEARRARDEEARRRAGEARMRIARELHDVLAHDISLINVQAGVALHLIDERPEQTRIALAAIKETSRDALRELRSVLGVLRLGDEAEPREPAPGLADLDTLVTRAEAAGLAVRRHVEGTPTSLAAGLDLAAYRILQEALTNVARHAAATTATIRVSYGSDEVAIEVVDDGPGHDNGPSPWPSPIPGTGSGIAGMRDRATALGGHLDAGPLPGGGFRVRARLPLDRPS